MLSQGDWTWLRTSVFMKWSDCDDIDKSCVTLLIFSAPSELIDRFERLWDQDPSSVLLDPFSLFNICFDELWLQSQSVVQVVQAVFGRMERVGEVPNCCMTLIADQLAELDCVRPSNVVKSGSQSKPDRFCWTA